MFAVVGEFVDSGCLCRFGSRCKQSCISVVAERIVSAVVSLLSRIVVVGVARS